MSANDLISILPELILTGTALLVLMWDLFISKEQRSSLLWVSLLGIIGAAVGNVLIGSPGTTFQGMVRADGIAQFLNFVLLISCGLSLLFSDGYLSRQKIERGEYYALVLTATLGAMLMGKSGNLLTLFLGLEVLSIPLYILASFWKENRNSQEAGLKYFLLGAFASAFFLYGIALIFGATGGTSILSTGATQRSVDWLLYGGVGLLLVGLSFKAAVIPFHAWAPDAYEGAPTSVTAFMSVIAKVGAFAALIRVVESSWMSSVHNWEFVVSVLAALTMVLGNILAITQTSLKRLLAYSSIAHAGYLLVGIVATNNLGTQGILFYLLTYGFMNLGAFGVVMALEKIGENPTLSDYAGLAKRHPWLAAAMAVFMISLAGIPPTAGFMAKLYVFGGAIQAGHYKLAIIGVLASVVSVYYYLRVVYFMYMRPAPQQEVPSYSTRLAFAAVILAVIGVLELGIFPGTWLEWMQQMLSVASR
ncbi:NADH-quinone oxidoreductase subunit N [Candidatus Acetothermia bacterium]|nr:NADH-quinone oxidoreductase subunit N [Candidatus Acetothermia bacterium]MBI3460713.1 NADH-quinone oxidoreductase subunit N [Candidatus Acetothermia bacterium]